MSTTKSRSPLLALPGPDFPSVSFDPQDESVEANRQRFFVSGKPVYLKLGLTDADHRVATAGAVWNCSLVLAKYLERQINAHANKWAGKHVVELGAGSGVVGICAAMSATQANVTLTDKEAVVRQQLRDNIALNSASFGPGTSVKAETLDWCDRGSSCDVVGPADFIVAADVVWVHDLIQPLVETIRGLWKEGCVMYLGYQSRSIRANTFLNDMLLHKARCEKVPHEDLDPVFWSPNVTIYKISEFFNV